MYKEPDISSSYKKVPVFGQYLYDYVMKHKPKKIVEFGVRYGYSTICMAQALSDLGKGHIHAYDSLAQEGLMQVIKIQDNIEDSGVDKFITFKVKDFYEWAENPEPFDLLHLDIDNDGDKLKFVRDRFPGKHIIFEGGIPARDDYSGGVPMVGSVPYEVLMPDFPGLSKML